SDILQRHDVRGQPRDVGARHRGAREARGGSVALDADGGHIYAGGKDVDVGAKVGEGGAAVSGGVNSADGEGAGGGARGGVGRVLLEAVLVSLCAFVESR